MWIFSRVVLTAVCALVLVLSPLSVGPSLAVDVAAGDILVADPGKGTIHHYSASGADLGDFASGLSAPSWITADPLGNIYVSEHDGQRVTKFSSTGANLLTITTGFNPGGIRVGADGTIFVVDRLGGKINRYSASGTDLGPFASTALDSADFMTFDAQGNLYVTGTDFSLLEVVRRFSPTGAYLGDFVSGFSAPAGIAFDTQGSFYVASFTSNIVQKYSSSGDDLGTFASGDPSGSFFGIAFDSSGNLYVANFAEGDIRLFSPAGADLGVFVSAGLDLPRDLVIVPMPANPTVKTECRADGWRSFDFENQGDCIQFVNTGK